jgi:hypothetical protein
MILLIKWLFRYGDVPRAVQLLSIMMDRGHARLASMMLSKQDNYKTTRDPEVHSGMFDDMQQQSQEHKEPVTAQDRIASTLSHLNASQTVTTDPQFVSPSSLFAVKDFAFLKRLADDAGNKSLSERIQSLLNQGAPPRRSSSKYNRSTQNR